MVRGGEVTKLQETPVTVNFVLDDKSPRPRIRIDVGTWYSCEIMPNSLFFELCAEYWLNNEDG